MFFDRLKKLCDDRGISTYKACTDIGLNRSAVAKWKTGGKPNGTTAAKLAEYFGVSTDYLLGQETEKAPTSNGERQPDILDEIDIAFYGDYRDLSEDDKETLRAMARVMKERMAKRKQEK